MFPTYVHIFFVLLYNGFAYGIVCQDGWVTFQDSCYLFARNHKSSFTEAENYCRQHGGHLVEIETKYESMFIRDYLRGMIDWHVSEPNSHGGEEDCAISSSGEDYQWADVPCDGRVAEPLCEVKSSEVDVGVIG
ncbi:lactose-binding lectin l-2-like isoform X2 [Ruditapes philippinarum]|uniref:lactose-binding lectin l-2-like isoform X2 n=1 Tax=Ruditapes philippinarum TaxID=129788 RepID=UPI00295A57FC|nr:lactose-binding lectin l-2-like isoform X2 [Ruditapes philippinarum]